MAVEGGVGWGWVGWDLINIGEIEERGANKHQHQSDTAGENSKI